MSSWDEATRTWVDKGWVAEDNRAALQAWLDEHRPPPEPSPFVDLALMAGVTVGNWLLVGAAALSVALLLPGSSELPLWVALGLGGLQFTAAVGFRVIGAKVLAQGFYSAWIVVTVVSGTALLDWPLRGGELAWAPVLLAPIALAIGLAYFDKMPGLAGTAGFAAISPLALLTLDRPTPGPEVVAVAMTLWVVGTIVVGRVAGERGEALFPTVPFATGIGLLGLSWHKHWIPTSVLQEAWAWETGGLSALVGFALLGGAAVARSRMVLVSGIAALIYSEIVLLIAVGDFWIGVGVLATEGVILVGGAVALLIWRTSAAQRADAFADEA